MHKVIAVMKIDGVATDVLWYEGNDLAKAIVSVGGAATREEDGRSEKISVLLVLSD